MASTYLTKQNEPKMKSLAHPEAEVQFWDPGVTLWTIKVPFLGLHTSKILKMHNIRYLLAILSKISLRSSL